MKMQRQENRITFEGGDKFILANNCERCNTQNTFEISLEKIFKLIERRKKATRGPIESVKALLNNQRPILK